MSLNKKMTIAKILILLVTVVISSYGMYDVADMSEEKASAMFDCISIIECVEKQGYEFKRMYEKAAPEGRQKFTKLFEEILNFAPELFEDIDQFFKDWSENMCVYTKDQRKNAFKQVTMHFGEWYEDVCKRLDTTECEKGEAAMNEGFKIVEEYTEKGKCNRPDEKAKQMGNDGMTDMKGFGG